MSLKTKESKTGFSEGPTIFIKTKIVITGYPTIFMKKEAVR